MKFIFKPKLPLGIFILKNLQLPTLKNNKYRKNY